MRLWNDYRIFLLAGAVWGFLTSVLYVRIISYQPLPSAVGLAFTVFLPGLVGKVLVYNSLGYLDAYSKEVFSAGVSVLVGAAIMFGIWWLVRLLRLK